MFQVKHPFHDPHVFAGHAPQPRDWPRGGRGGHRQGGAPRTGGAAEPQEAHRLLHLLWTHRRRARLRARRGGRVASFVWVWGFIAGHFTIGWLLSRGEKLK